MLKTNTVKRISAFFLALMMILGTLPLNVFAEGLQGKTADPIVIDSSTINEEEPADEEDSTTGSKTHVISFNPNGGSGEMKPVEVADGKNYTLPKNEFKAPEGKEFKNWLIEDQEQKEGYTLVVTRDLEIKAQWEEVKENPIKKTLNSLFGKENKEDLDAKTESAPKVKEDAGKEKSGLEISKEEINGAVKEEQPTRIDEFDVSWVGTEDTTVTMTNGHQFSNPTKARIKWSLSGNKDYPAGSIVIEMPEFLKIEEGVAKRSTEKYGDKVEYDKVGFVLKNIPHPKAEFAGGKINFSYNYGDADFAWYFEDQTSTVKFVNVKTLSQGNSGNFDVDYEFNKQNVQYTKTGTITNPVVASLNVDLDGVKLEKQADKKLSIQSITTMGGSVTSSAVNNVLENKEAIMNQFEEWDDVYFPEELKPSDSEKYFYSLYKVQINTDSQWQNFNLKVKDYVTDDQEILGYTNSFIRYRVKRDSSLDHFIPPLTSRDSMKQWNKAPDKKEINLEFNDNIQPRDDRYLYDNQDYGIDRYYENIFYVLTKTPKSVVKEEPSKYYNFVEVEFDKAPSGDTVINSSDSAFSELSTEPKVPYKVPEANLSFDSLISSKLYGYEENNYSEKLKATDTNYWFYLNNTFRVNMQKETYDSTFGATDNINAYGKKKWKFELVSDYLFAKDDNTTELTNDDYKIKVISFLTTNIDDVKYNYELKKYETIKANLKDEVYNVYVRKSSTGDWVKACDLEIYKDFDGITRAMPINENTQICKAYNGYKVYFKDNFTAVKISGETTYPNLFLKYYVRYDINIESPRIKKYIETTKTEDLDFDMSFRVDSTHNLYDSDDNVIFGDISNDKYNLTDGKISNHDIDYKRSHELDKENYGFEAYHTTAFYNVKKESKTDIREQSTESYFSKKNDLSNKEFILNYRTSYEGHLSGLAFKDGLSPDVKKEVENRLPFRNKLRFYTLLPKGASQIKNVSIRNGYSPYNKLYFQMEHENKIIKNYKNSGRDLVLTDVYIDDFYEGNIFKDNRDIGWDIIVEFDVVYPWDSYKDYGSKLKTLTAVETDRNTSEKEHYIDKTVVNSAEVSDVGVGGFGKPDNAMNFGQERYRDSEKWTEEDRKIMTDLNPEHDEPRFLYSAYESNLSGNTASITGLTKQVSGDLSPKMGLTSKVKECGQYQYKLRMQPVAETSVSDLIFYDSIENYKPLDTEEDFGVKQWKGKIKSIDVSQLTNRGVDAKIYVSDQDLNFKEHRDPEKDSAWRLYKVGDDLSKVQSIAVDCRKNTDGTDFILKESSAVVLINMEAPIDSAIKPEDKAINKVYASGTTVMDDGDMGGEIISTGYTTVTLEKAVKKVKLTAKKILLDEEDKAMTDIPEFTFDVKNEQGDIIATAKNDKAGNIVFPEIEYTSDDLNTTHKLTIEEVNNGGSYEYDEHKETVEVEVFEDRGRLSDNIVGVEVKYDQDGANFTNKKLSKVSLQIVRLAQGENPFVADEVKNDKDVVVSHKISDQDKAKTVDGAEYDLYLVNDDNTETKVTSLKTVDGISNLVENLLPGKYKIKETKAPEGYFAASKDFEFEITKEDAGKALVKFISSDDDGGKIMDMPSTGGQGTKALMIGGGVLLITMAGVFVLASKKKKELNK